MIGLFLMIFVVAGGMTIDAQPVEKKPEIKTEFKKAIQINNPNWKIDMLIDSINRRMEHGDATLMRCPKTSCKTISELKEVL